MMAAYLDNAGCFGVYNTTSIDFNRHRCVQGSGL
jgi:hypothetical protein